MPRRRPYAYLRRSHAGPAATNGQMSFDAQRSAVLELAGRRGDPEPELIIEWGVSGAARASSFGGTGRGGKRKAYHELRAAIDDDRVSALYSYSLSRLARSTRELLDLAEACVAHNVPIRTSKEGDIDGSSPTGRLYLTVLAAVATFEAENAADRARDRNAAMRDDGRYLGRAPFGYVIEDGKLVPNPAETETLARVLALYADLRSPAKVARALNLEGVGAPEGGARGWGDGTVRRILARQPDAMTPATVRGSRAVPAALFARLLVCHCGSTMTPTRKRYRTAAGAERQWIGYVCQAARWGTGHTGPRAVAEAAVIAAAKVEAAHLRVPEDQYITETNAESQRAELDGRRGRIIDALEAGIVTRAEAEPRLARIVDELAKVEAATEIIDVPAISWTWGPEALGPVLRALWHRIELDVDGTIKTPFGWNYPEWRAD